MEKKQIELWKIVLLCIIAVSIFIGIYLLTINIINKSIESENGTFHKEQRVSSYFPNPDRLIIKRKQEDSYYIIEQEDGDYVKLIKTLENGIKESNNQYELYSKEQLDNIENNGYFLMLDYNKVSKNYIVSFTDKKMLRYLDVGGTVVRQNMKTDKLENEIEKIVKDKKSYKAHSEEIYSNNKIETIPEFWKESLKEIKDGIYQGKITDENQLENCKNDLNLELIYAEDEDSKKTLEDYDVIITISKYPIKDVYGTIRNIKYTYSSNKEESYQVHFYFASKAINSNCIYNNVDQVIKNGESETKNGIYQTTEYLPNYRVYSDYTISDETAKRLGFSKQKGGIYTVAIQSRAQLNNINQVLKLYGFSVDGIDKYQDVYIPNNNYQYILCIKNTNGHFEADLKGRGDYVNGVSFDGHSINLVSYEKQDSASKMKLQGNLLALPKQVQYTKFDISEASYSNTYFANNPRKISVAQAKEIAKAYLGDTTNTQAFLDILSQTTPLVPYSVVHADTFKRVWVVTTEDYGMPTAIVIDATTGEIIGMNEMGC